VIAVEVIRDPIGPALPRICATLAANAGITSDPHPAI
jgi:hypothetical protein